MLGLFRDPKDINELQGIWERTGDEFEGSLVKVYQEQDELIGQLIVSTPAMLKAGWEIGDKKWRRIEYMPNEGWQLLDLCKQYDTQNKKLISTDYAHYWISIGGFQNSRTLRLHQSKVPLFSEQNWKKVGELLVK
ncbi:MAG: hypothetical protein NT164_04325 [Verrucomicrobiae bacterium]|nr:hypothetical protein [Verrucomicrobiae bacterium]